MLELTALRMTGTRPTVVLALAALAALAGCSPAARPLDFLRARDELVEVQVAGRGRDWFLPQLGKQVRLKDTVRRTIPASPPSRLRYRLDIPKGSFLHLSAGIPADRHDRPAVEFVVKVRSGEREETAWTMLLDPVSRPAHRKWVTAEVDLGPYVGRGREIVLETRGFEQGEDDARRAFWGDLSLSVPDDRAPIAIVYLVDTLRADHTTPYGYPRDTTPELMAFSKDAVVFETAVSQASWTKPSTASIFTSMLPGRHRAVQLRDPLDLGQVTMAEMLQARGFATGAAIANSVIYSEGTNFEQGFDFYAGLHGAGDRPSKIVEAAGVVDEALHWLKARSGFPTFFYVHTMDPHVPYTPPAPFDMKFEPHPVPGRPTADPRFDAKEPADRDRLMAQYDGEIAYGDQEFGRFVRELKARGLYDRALIVFTADHGEEFEDHGQWLHGRSVFDELIRVPMIVKLPGGAHAGKRVKQQVQSMDILPTVLQALGLPVPPSPVITGHPLQAVIEGGAPEPPAVSEISHRGYVAHGMRTGRDKFIRRFSPQDDELYFDLVADPKETTNRIDQARDRVRMLKAGVEQAMVANPFRYNLRFEAPGAYEVKLKSGGWMEGVEAAGLGQGERYETENAGRGLVLTVRPRPGQLREVAFGVRPLGAPVWLSGTRDGQPLRPGDVYMAREGIHPAAVPFALPEIETEKERTEDIFAPPPSGRAGIHVWLTLLAGHQPMAMSKAKCEELKALGYISGDCQGK
jgi:arylsulfatase A-like enzyme